ncbi:MAG: hypothetical protein U0234_06970 [Sandaracinus sp.]
MKSAGSVGWLVVASSLVACGSSATTPVSSEPPPTTAPPPSTTVVTPPPSSAPPPTPAADSGAQTPITFVSDELLVTPTSVTVARGGAPVSEVLSSMRCVPGEMGGGVLGMPRPGEASDCTWASTHCHGTMHVESWVMPAASGRNATIHGEATASADAATCARFEGEYGASVISDPAAGGPGPGPQFEGAACLVQDQIVSGTVCASISRPSDATTATTYRGACCLGERIAEIPISGASPVLAVASDGQAVVQVSSTFVTPADVAANAVIVTIARASGTTEVRLATLLAGDPVLTGGTGFGLNVSVDGTDLVASAVGGAPHRMPL